MAPNSPGIPGLSSFSPIAITAGIAQFQIVRLVIPCRSHYAWWKTTIFIGMYWLYWYLYPSIHHFPTTWGISVALHSTAAFPVWWSRGAALVATYLLPGQKHGTHMLSRRPGMKPLGLVLKLIGKRLNPMVNSRFPYFWWPFHHWRKTHEVPLWHTIFDHRIPWRWGHTSEVLIPMPSWSLWAGSLADLEGLLLLVALFGLTGTAEETRSHGGNVALCALAQGQHLFDAGFACSLRWNDVKWSIEFLQWVCFVSDFGHLRCHQQNLQSSQSSQSSKFWSQAFWFRRHPTSLLQFPPWSRSGFLMPTWTPSVPRWNYGSYFGGWHQAMDAPFFNIFHISTVDIRGPSWTMVDPDGLRPVEAFTKTSVKRSIVKWSQELILWWMRGWRWRRTGNWSELIGEKGQVGYVVDDVSICPVWFRIFRLHCKACKTDLYVTHTLDSRTPCCEHVFRWRIIVLIHIAVLANRLCHQWNTYALRSIS